MPKKLGNRPCYKCKLCTIVETTYFKMSGSIFFPKLRKEINTKMEKEVECSKTFIVNTGEEETLQEYYSDHPEIYNERFDCEHFEEGESKIKRKREQDIEYCPME